MNEDQLLEKCQPYPIKERIVFHSSVQYGYSKVLRRMAFYPKFLPLCSYFEHSSPPFYDEMWELERSFLTDIFFHRKVFADQWNEKFKPNNKAKARTFTSPFVWYKEKEAISVSEQATGSVFFIYHSREGIERKHDQKKIINKINSLEKVFHPITFCFYYLDILKGSHKPFQELGYNIVTVGNKENPNYISDFYNVISKFKYALTNSIGGHLLFATNLGIPVSYFEDLEPVNTSEIKGYLERIKQLKKGKTFTEAKKLFSGVQVEITLDQIHFTDKMLGVNSNTSRFLMSIILYKSLINFILFKIRKKIK